MGGIVQELPLKRKLLPGIIAGAAGGPPLALRGSLAPPKNPQLFVVWFGFVIFATLVFFRRENV
jgi:hypothetical protein